MTIREKIARLMKLSNKAAVAKEAGLSPSTLSEILSGKQGARLVTVTALAKALGVNIGWLVDETQHWPPVRVESPEPTHCAAA